MCLADFKEQDLRVELVLDRVLGEWYGFRSETCFSLGF